MAAVAYLRIIERHGKMHAYLLMGNTQVTPIRAMTIPRLELQACCMAVKLAQFIIKQLDLTFIKSSV